MRIAVVRERAARERRVALSPEATANLVADGHEVVVESGAGDSANMPDTAYADAGATVVADRAAAGGNLTVVGRKGAVAAAAAHWNVVVLTARLWTKSVE